MALYAVVIFYFLRGIIPGKHYYNERENIMKKVLALLLTLIMTVSLAGCGGSGGSGGSASSEGTDVKSGVEDGVLTVAMECGYAPYNWTQTDDSNGAVPIKDSNEYANGYDGEKDLRSQRLGTGNRPYRLGFSCSGRSDRNL